MAIIIAARNSWSDLETCIASIPRGVGEVIVVDNGSTDGTADNLRTLYPDIRVITNASNLGHCRAINQGLRAISRRFVLVLDADTVLGPNALDRLVGLLRSRPDVVIVAPRMLNVDGSVQETARAFPRPINGLFGRQTVLTRLFPDNRFSKRYLRRTQILATDPFEVDWVSAACMLFRRSLIEAIGLWDEGFDGYWVDADWCKRAHRAGRVFCEPSARVLHVEHNRSGRRKDVGRIIQFHAGVSRFYRKHYTLGWLDPRGLATSAVLAARAALLIAGNALNRADASPVDAVSPCQPDHVELGQ